MRQLVREWLHWEVDVLFPPIFNCYGIQLGKQNLLPISVEPAIADYHGRRAEAALSVFDTHLGKETYLCSGEPTIADLVCRCDVAFAEISAIDLGRWKNVSSWAARMAALPGFKAPLELLPMADAEFSSGMWGMAADGNEKAARGSAPAEGLSDRRIESGCNARFWGSRTQTCVPATKK